MSGESRLFEISYSYIASKLYLYCFQRFRLATRDASMLRYCDRPMYYTGGYFAVLGSVAVGTLIVTETAIDVEILHKNIEKYRVNVHFENVLSL